MPLFPSMIKNPLMVRIATCHLLFYQDLLLYASLDVLCLCIIFHPKNLNRNIVVTTLFCGRRSLKSI